MKTDRKLLIRYKQAVSDHLQLGPANQWKQRDLEHLIDLIDEKSGIRLSLSTLKRLVKDDFTQLPHASTLNALVSILGFKDWQEFRLVNVSKPMNSTRALVLVSGLVIVLIVALLVIPGFEQTTQDKPIVSGDIHLSANKTISTGVPNTVIFNYDVKNVVADSFSLQQSWNESERMTIDPVENFYSQTYYYPGYHQAKLIANDSILVRLPVHITTEGWKPIIRFDFYESLPVYPIGEFVHDDILQLTKEDLIQNNITSDRDLSLTYYNIRDFGELSSDNFYLSIRLKNDSLSNQVCPEMWFTVHAEKDIFYTPFTIKGCEGNMEAKYGETLHHGSNFDMSPFRGDVFQWQEFELIVVNKEVLLKLNGEDILVSNFEEDFGKIVGLTCSFNGLGSVDYVQLGHSITDLNYKDDFSL